MNSELLAVGAAFAGVAVGFVGSLAAASIQRKGSQAQADATAQSAVTTAEAVYQAAVTTSEAGYRAAVTTSETAYQAAITSSETAYRAAVAASESQAQATLTTAKTQYASALEALNRTAQRAAYVSFITATATLRRAAEEALDRAEDWSRQDDDQLNLDDLKESLRTLQMAHAAVELEGPPLVLTPANETLDRAQTLTTEITRHALVPKAERALSRATSFLSSVEGTPERETVLRARQALNDLRQLRWADEGAQAERESMIQRARETMESVAHLVTWQRRTLVWWAAERPEGFSQFMRQQQSDFTEASSAFVNAARAYLNDTQPVM